ncbi:uncharacterized protein J4E79_007918 [Alternaria viburni]|uniref:uncharacterized protein n=1 Tax=Alternaria viburni TaxID=566460 RepID=UPI0020C5445C|nr:uncharacterized protein J4E79_007918 [Alternaria viburni]KAI4656365.1 hypothetical protein J4E79_007918 [Alternaria viburni]
MEDSFVPYAKAMPGNMFSHLLVILSCIGNTIAQQAGRNVTFWTGDPIGWSGIIRVDGTAYEYMGDSPSVQGLQKATPLTVSYDSHYSNFTFDAGPVRVEARFFSPVLPKDLCKSSIPLSYLEVEWAATDELSHNVQLYSDIDSSWLAGGNISSDWTIDCPGESFGETQCPPKGTETPDTLFHWEALIVDELSWSDRGHKQEPYWGSLHYVSSPGMSTNFDTANGLATTIRQQFVNGDTVDNSFDQNQSRGPSPDQMLVFGFLHNFASSQSGSALYTIGTTQEPAVNYRTASGDVELRPWWLTSNCYYNTNNMIRRHYQDYPATAKEAKFWTMKLRNDVEYYYAEDKATDMHAEVSSLSEEESYYAIVALSARQILAANVLTESADNTTGPTIFQKEISSDGKVNTADVIYPALPFWLYANPELLRLLLKPVFEFQESGLYHERYAMHDIGRFYPNAIGYYSSTVPDEEGEEAMPVEESANMVILAASYYLATNDTAFLVSHYDILKRWSEYLVENCPYPEHQTTTGKYKAARQHQEHDFNEPIANNTNLAIKGIVALNCMGVIAQANGDRGYGAGRWIRNAYFYYTLWSESAFNPSTNHTLLAYNLPDSYSILYNIFPALLFNLRAIPKSLFTMQSDFYPTVAQKYGVPLDNRRLWTKSDWEMWAAATSRPETRALFVNSLAKWINETSTDKALSDHFMTTGDGGYTDYPFVARPVVGGHFALLAMGLFGRHGVVNGEDE